MTLRAMQIPPLLQKYFEPPRNEILDTPLIKRHIFIDVTTSKNLASIPPPPPPPWTFLDTPLDTGVSTIHSTTVHIM